MRRPGGFPLSTLLRPTPLGDFEWVIAEKAEKKRRIDSKGQKGQWKSRDQLLISFGYDQNNPDSPMSTRTRGFDEQNPQNDLHFKLEISCDEREISSLRCRSGSIDSAVHQ